MAITHILTKPGYGSVQANGPIRREDFAFHEAEDIAAFIRLFAPSGIRGVSLGAALRLADILDGIGLAWINRAANLDLKPGRKKTDDEAMEFLCGALTALVLVSADYQEHANRIAYFAQFRPDDTLRRFVATNKETTP